VGHVGRSGSGALFVDGAYRLANWGAGMTKDEALKLALEALDGDHIDRAYGYIQEALAQPEQEPWLLETTQALAKTLAREFYPEVPQWTCLNDLAGVISQIDNMTTGLMRKSDQDWEAVAADQAMTIAMMKCKQEPVAWMYTSKWKGNERFITRYQSELTTYKADEVWPLYTSPPQRQPLTEEEIDECFEFIIEHDTQAVRFARAIEAKLKEKNA
jgi:hypothetical protein